MPKVKREGFLKILPYPVVVGFSVFGLDRLTKIVLSNRMSPGESVPIFPSIFHVTLVLNKGMAFGLFNRSASLLPCIAGVTALILLFLLYKKRNDFVTGVSLGLIIGGAIGNLVDRIRLGYVIDFLDFRIWPVFNLADSSITIGAILLAWKIIKNQKSNIKNQNC